MLDAFKAHIRNSFPELIGEKSIIACSGGLDSVVLVDLMAKAGLEFSIAHCNFQLRDEESDGDEIFVRNLASKYDCIIEVKRFNTAKYTSLNKVSVQMAARALRYEWFNEIADENSRSFVLTAHHADDNLETFIINLSRGSGIKGLSGIPPKTGIYLRPLLTFSRAEILDYAKANQLEWREDSSNREKYYLRNKIRHDIVPGLKELSASFLENFKQSISNLHGVSTIFDNHINQVRSELFEPYGSGWKIEVNVLDQLKPTKAYLYALFSEYGFTEWSNIEDLLSASSGKEVVSGTHRLIKDRDSLILAPKDARSTEVFEFIPGTGRIQGPVPMQIDSVPSISEHSRDILYVDKETLNHRLEVRKWKKGDYFYPLGMKGRKLVSKFFKDEKYDALQKEDQWLLFSGDKLVWVIGKRADDRFKVVPQTREILRFQLVE